MDLPFAVFDMDGTLIDSMGSWYEVCRTFLRACGVNDFSEEIIRQTGALTMDESAALLTGVYGLCVPQAEAAARLDELMLRCYETSVPAKSGVKAYLDRLSRNGTQMCVASASPVHAIRSCLDRLDLLPYFSFLLSCDDVGAGKTDPAVYREAARRFGATPRSVAVFEDSLSSLQTAKRAGFFTVAVYDENAAAAWGTLSSLADETVRDWNDLL